MTTDVYGEPIVRGDDDPLEGTSEYQCEIIGGITVLILVGGLIAYWFELM